MAASWQTLGMDIRIYLTGRVGLEFQGKFVIDEQQFRGRQTRLVFACLTCERTRPVPREELATIVWPKAVPQAWETALAALVSRIRGLLARASLSPLVASVSGAFGQYQLRLPADTWVDIEEAASSIDAAEGALRAGDFQRAFGPATVAATIARRPFLSGDGGEWVESRRRKLRRQSQRALECLARVWLRSGEPELAVEAATEAVALDSFRESSYRLLIQAYGAIGNRAEALRIYGRLRTLLAEELGTDPSPETEALYLDLLA